MTDPSDSRPRENPRVPTPEDDPRLGSLCNPAGSLVELLAPVVDAARQLNTTFGLRPYRVFSVVTKWTGGQVGLGTEELVQAKEILPTPKVFVDALRRVPLAGGWVERGDSRLEEISPRYTEDDIRILFHRQPLPLGFSGWIEIAIDERDGSTVRRRFTVRGTPQRKAFQWTVSLNQQDSGRERSGRVRQVDEPEESEP